MPLCSSSLTGRRAQGKILHEQEVDLVAVGRRFHFLVEVMDQEIAQHRFIGQRGGLQKLAELVNLNVSVDLLEPGVCLFDAFFGGRLSFVDGRAGRHVDDEFLHQRGIDRLQRTELLPLFVESCMRWSWGHDLMIQLGTVFRKRAATTVRWVWY